MQRTRMGFGEASWSSAAKANLALPRISSKIVPTNFMALTGWKLRCRHPARDHPPLWPMRLLARCTCRGHRTARHPTRPARGRRVPRDEHIRLLTDRIDHRHRHIAVLFEVGMLRGGELDGHEIMVT